MSGHSTNEFFQFAVVVGPLNDIIHPIQRHIDRLGFGFDLKGQSVSNMVAAFMWDAHQCSLDKGSDFSDLAQRC